MSSSEVLVHIIRGPLVESRHRGAIAVADAGGALLRAVGDAEAATFARSAAKPIQAIPVIESGAADAFGFTPEEIALVCASHNGEERHIEAVRSMLGKIGLGDSALLCGPHAPYHQASADRLKARGEPFSCLHNNCSGKHAGMLALAQRLHAPLETYLHLDHPVQQRMVEIVSDMSGLPRERLSFGTDGCGVPVFGMPLMHLAAMYARLGAFGQAARSRGHVGGNGVRAAGRHGQACRRILDAVAQHPYFLAGSGRFDTRLIEVTNGRIIGKMGAEGVFALTVPSEGIGLAVKIEDGAQRALYPVVAEALSQLGLLQAAEAEALEPFRHPEIRNWQGTVVGRIIPVFRF